MKTFNTMIKNKLWLLIMMLVCVNAMAQERMISGDGQRFRIKEMGTGTITVLFESGMSDSLEVWGSIPDSVALFAKVFLYDRADIGKSDTSRQQRTIPNTVNELRAILQQEGIKPPYILVGHSLGGFITRYFTSEHPSEVKGLLLLDPAPESFWEGMSKRELKKYVEGGNEWYRTKFEPRYRNEWYEFIPNMKYMKDLTIPSDMPITLVSASAWHWYKYHKKIIEGFTNTRHIELEGEHHIFRQHPTKIVDYIKQLIEM